MAHRTRLAPPPNLKHLPTKSVAGTFNIQCLQAQGWTIVESEGMASTDPPEAVREQMSAVQEPKKRGRPRIVKNNG